jgi:2-keto-3-deoxy-L-rhamnonate aldolase RhmA
MEMMADGARRAHAVGKPVGTVGGSTDVVAQYRAMGYDFIGVASDLGLLMRGAAAALQSLRTQEGGSHVHTLSTGTATEGGY